MTTTPTGTSEDQIRRQLEARVRTIHDRDAQALGRVCAPDILSFDALPPLRRLGADAVRSRAEEWLSGYAGLVGYEIRDLQITAGEDIAFAAHLYHVTGTLKTGAQVDLRVRSTVCFRRQDGATGRLRTSTPQCLSMRRPVRPLSISP